MLGESCVVFAKSYLGYRTELGDGVIVNTGTQIDHHCKIENGVTLDPGCVIAGNVYIGERAHLHTSVTVINRINIGKCSEIGAGSLVLKDVHERTLNYGTPATRIRELPNQKSEI